MRALDTHAHLADLPDIEGSVARASGKGIIGIVAVSANKITSEKTLALADAYPDYIYPAIGIHPTEWLGDDVDSTIDFIRRAAGGVRAIGEIGLDYWGKFKDEALREKQRGIYTALLEIAKEYDLPVSIHSRGAWKDAIKMAEEHGPEKGVFHWFSGPTDLVPRIVDSGYYVSCTPALEYSKELREAMSEAPLDRILVETDSPVYIRNQQRQSEPADVLLTIRHLAQLKGLSEEETAEATTANAETLFNHPGPI